MSRLVVCSVLALALLPARAQAAADGPALFALVVGVNGSVDTDLAPLFYADDDAARYRDLFVGLGARVVLLTRPDQNTRRVLPHAVADAKLPRRGPLDEAVAKLSAEVTSARAAGRKTAFYFVYAGHGNIGEHGAYLTLEDHRLTGAEIDRAILRPVGADDSHLIVDACYSYYLAYPRGPGGRAREVRGFSKAGGLLDREDVGLLLSTSAARESHEWEGFQAGVFSHEVRSGLYGAADADGDGAISYREIAAFVVRANAAIPNERFRPDFFARPPRGRERLVALGSGLATGLTFDPSVEPGHYLVEDGNGNRMAEFHSSRGQTVRLLRAGDPQVLYLREVRSGREYEVPERVAEVQVSALASKTAPVRARGAAHHAFTLIFSLPFDQRAVQEMDLGTLHPVDRGDPDARPAWRTGLALGALGLAVLGAATSATLVIRSHSLEDEALAADQQQTAVLNERIRTHNKQALVVGASAAGLAAAGLALWLWPNRPVTPAVALGPEGNTLLGAVGRF